MEKDLCNIFELNIGINFIILLFNESKYLISSKNDTWVFQIFEFPEITNKNLHKFNKNVGNIFIELKFNLTDSGPLLRVTDNMPFDSINALFT